MRWISPFSPPGSWYKGNLHTHTTQSDGLLAPDRAIAWYRRQGYDFLGISDHWIVTPGSRNQEGESDFVTVTAAELHGHGYHMLAVGLTSLPDRRLEDSPQALADEIAAQGGLAYFAHPYWTGQTSSEMRQTPSIAGLEVYNSVCDKMDGLGYANVQWDELLAEGMRLVGLAVDDVHWKHGAEGQGFIMVRATDLSEPAILRALRDGHFYASTGPIIVDLRVVTLGEGQAALRVRCSPCADITFYAARSRGHRFVSPDGGLLDGAVYPLLDDQVYLRIECRDALGRVAWTNPVFVADVLD